MKQFHCSSDTFVHLCFVVCISSRMGCPREHQSLLVVRHPCLSVFLARTSDWLVWLIHNASTLQHFNTSALQHFNTQHNTTQHNTTPMEHNIGTSRRCATMMAKSSHPPPPPSSSSTAFASSNKKQERVTSFFVPKSSNKRPRAQQQHDEQQQSRFGTCPLCSRNFPCTSWNLTRLCAMEEFQWKVPQKSHRL